MLHTTALLCECIRQAELEITAVGASRKTLANSAFLQLDNQPFVNASAETITDTD
jgi:hypothetical protein